ncbi:FAD-dependent oxidoreductase [Risungbinella massiliensis]|uniref:FAD-dependent oxidoreductase n=1 Tax=Risungbinella massiliensis TaxID=1329796 RepID=UPI0005CBB8F2|nr:FAD-dependent oxidoreductase [Risungbinella massiliensis]
MTSTNKSWSQPTNPEPLWRGMVDLPTYPSLQEGIDTDVAIIGAGISGITAAYLLSQEGLRVTVIDSNKILYGTTGHTTAKMTAQHDLIYDELLQHMGKEKAQAYYLANTDAIQFMRRTAEDLSIQCDMETQDAYIYAYQKSSLSQMEKEIQAYWSLGIPGEYLDHLSIPVLGVEAAIKMPNQAQFNPLKYLAGLVKEVEKNGGKFYENTTASYIEDGDEPKVVLERGAKISCRHVIIASHFPFYDKGFYFTRMYADRSYVGAIKPKHPYSGGMYVSIDTPGRSLRSVKVNGEDWILFGGDTHKTGQGGSTQHYYEEIERFAEETFGIAEYGWRWSAQDLHTLDKVPYIGQLTADRPNVWVATGYRKWGMTHGTLSGMILKDLILQRENPFAELYDPQRFHADPSIRSFIVENADVAGHLIAGKVGMNFEKIENIQNDQGAIVRVRGERCGAYKDQDGKLHIVDTTCTHLGCEVNWNSGDRTWDCPCHGSRYSYDGNVIEGPAKEPLAKVELEEQES